MTSDPSIPSVGTLRNGFGIEITSPSSIDITTPSLTADSNSSSHGSPSYGKYYTNEEITEIFAPPHHAVEAVKSWLSRSGIASDKISQSTNKQWIQFDVETHEAERLFRTQYHVYGHEESGRTNIACDESVAIFTTLSSY